MTGSIASVSQPAFSVILSRASIMIRMLMVDDAAQLLLAVVLQRGLAWQVRDRDHPAEPGFSAILPDRDQPVRPVESASHDLDAGAVDAAETEGRAAIPAKIAFGNRGRAECGRFAARPGEVVLFDLGKRGEWRAGCLLTHAAMADADLGRRCRQREADCAALAPTGQNGISRRSHTV